MSAIRPVANGRRTRSLVAVLLMCGLVVLALASPMTAATFGPALLLFVALGRGVHPGERLIVGLLSRAVHRRRRLAVRIGAPRLPLVRRRTGLHRAMALAMRPPPAPAGSRLG